MPSPPNGDVSESMLYPGVFLADFPLMKISWLADSGMMFLPSTFRSQP